MADCGKHGYQHKKKLLYWLLGSLSTSIILILIIILITIGINPTKANFTIQDATLHTFNLSSTNPSLLTSTIQVTLISHNLNDHTDIIYDNLGVHASYHDQQITLTSRLQSLYQNHNQRNVWSLFLLGSLVPINPNNAVALAQDQNLEAVDIVIVMNGQVRYKVGPITHGMCHLNVKCPARLTFGSRSTGVVMGNGVKYQLVERCSVSV